MHTSTPRSDTKRILSPSRPVKSNNPSLPSSHIHAPSQRNVFGVEDLESWEGLPCSKIGSNDYSVFNPTKSRVMPRTNNDSLPSSPLPPSSPPPTSALCSPMHQRAEESFPSIDPFGFLTAEKHLKFKKPFLALDEYSSLKARSLKTRHSIKDRRTVLKPKIPKEKTKTPSQKKTRSSTPLKAASRTSKPDSYSLKSRRNKDILSESLSNEPNLILDARTPSTPKASHALSTTRQRKKRQASRQVENAAPKVISKAKKDRITLNFMTDEEREVFPVFICDPRVNERSILYCRNQNSLDEKGLNISRVLIAIRLQRKVYGLFE